MVQDQFEALHNLGQALESFSQKNNRQSSKSSEEKSSKSEEEGEGEDGQSSSEEDGSEQKGSSDIGEISLEKQSLPLPNKSPQDIMKMERALQKKRAADKKSNKQQPVKKDW